MKNSILNYDTEELEEFIVKDYFSKNVDVYNIFSELEEFLEQYKMADDDKLERISYELYGDPNYWDLLLLINDKNPLLQMSYNYDVLLNDVEDKIAVYSNLIYSHPPLTAERLAAGYDILLNKADDNNENNRFIYVVKPNQLNDVLSILKEKGYI